MGEREHSEGRVSAVHEMKCQFSGSCQGYERGCFLCLPLLSSAIARETSLGRQGSSCPNWVEKGVEANVDAALMLGSRAHRSGACTMYVSHYSKLLYENLWTQSGEFATEPSGASAYQATCSRGPNLIFPRP